MVRIIECDRNICVAEGLTIFRSRKDNILHRGSSKLLDRLFSKDPAYCVRNVTLAASVRSYDSRNSFMKIKYDLVGKRFKAVYLNTF